jgi:hypothetical protein
MRYVHGMFIRSHLLRSPSIGTLLAVMLVSLNAAAQQPARPFEGTWVWDRTLYIPPPNIKYDTGIVAETVTVSVDDGYHYEAISEQVFSNGANVTLIENFAEDGSDHRVDYPPDGATVRMSSTLDGGRRIVFARMGSVNDSTCHVSADGNTMTCIGTETEPDGSTGQDRCVFQRKLHFVPVS